MTADMDAMVAWLRGVLDERERLANAATRGPWRVANVWKDCFATVHGPDEIQDGEGPFGDRRTALRPAEVIPQDSEYGPTVDLADAAFIADNDPLQVLAAVVAVRWMITEYMQIKARYDDIQYWETGMLMEQMEAVLRHVTAAHAHLPGYRQEWAL